MPDAASCGSAWYGSQHICDVDTHMHLPVRPSVRPSCVRFSSPSRVSVYTRVTCVIVREYVRYVRFTCGHRAWLELLSFVESEIDSRLHNETKKKHGGLFTYRAHYALCTLAMYAYAPPSVRPSRLLLHPCLGMFTVCKEAHKLWLFDSIY